MYEETRAKEAYVRAESLLGALPADRKSHIAGDGWVERGSTAALPRNPSRHHRGGNTAA